MKITFLIWLLEHKLALILLRKKASFFFAFYWFTVSNSLWGNWVVSCAHISRASLHLWSSLAAVTKLIWRFRISPSPPACPSLQTTLNLAKPFFSCNCTPPHTSIRAKHAAASYDWKRPCIQLVFVFANWHYKVQIFLYEEFGLLVYFSSLVQRSSKPSFWSAALLCFQLLAEDNSIIAHVCCSH